MSITLADILIAFRGDRTHVDRTQADLTRDLRRFGDQPVNVRIVSDSSGLQQGLRNAQEQVRGAGERASGVLRGALSFVAGSVLTAGLTAVAGGIASIAQGMVGGNAAFEDYQVRFTTLLNSTELAKQRMAELATFAANTPFELPNVVQADLVLQGFGFHSAEAAKKFAFSGDQIRTIAGDTASGTGRSFEEISDLLGQISTGQTGDALNQFQRLGAVNRDQLRAMGVEFSASGELISDKTKAMTALLTILQGKYGGLMEAQSMTLGGMTSNLADWMKNAARIVGAPLFEGLRTSLFMLLQVLNSPEATAGLQAMAQGMAGLVAAVGRVVQAVLPVAAFVAGVFVPLVKLGAEWGSGFLNAFASGISAAVGVVADALGGMASMITGLLMPHSPPKILPDLDTWGTKAAEVWMGGWQEADFSLFESIGKSVNQALANAVGAGQLKEADQIPMLAQAKSAIAEMMQAWQADGAAGNSATDASYFDKIKAAVGPASQGVYAMVLAYMRLDTASRTVKAAQDDLNTVTDRYSAILNPLNAQLSGVQRQMALVRDQQRLTEINKKLPGATGDEKKLLMLEKQQLGLQRQISVQTQAKDAETQAGEAKLKAAQKEEQQQKATLATLQAKQQMETESLAMAKQQIELLKKLAKEAANSSGSMGDLAASQGKINAAVEEARAKAAALKKQYEDLKAKITAPFAAGQAAIAPFLDALKRLQDVFQLGVVSGGGLIGGITYLLATITNGNPLFVTLAERAGALQQAFRVGSVNGFTGGLANMLASLGDLNPAFGTLADVVARIGDVLDWARGTLGTFARDLVTNGPGAALAGLGARIAAALPGMLAAGRDLAHGLVTALVGAIPEGIRTRITAVGAPIVAALAGVFGGLTLGPMVAGVLTTIGTAVSAVFGAIGPLLGGITPMLGGLGALLAPLGGVLTGLFTTVGLSLALLSQRIPTFGALFAGLLGIVGQGFSGLHLLGGLLFGWLGMLPALLGNLGLSLALLSQRIPSFGAMFAGLRGIFANVGGGLMGVITRLGPMLAQFGMNFWKIGKSILSLVTPFGIIMTLVDAFVGAWLTNFGGIRQVTATALGPLLPILTQLGRVFGDVFTLLLKGDVQTALDLLGLAFSQFGLLFAPLAASLQTGIPAIFAILMQYLGQMATQIIGWLGAALPPIITTLGQWALAFLDWIVPMIPPLLEALGGLLGTIVVAIGNAIPGIVAAISGFIGAFVDWVLVAGPPLLVQLGGLIVKLLAWCAEQIPPLAKQLGEWALQFLGWIGPLIPKLILTLGELYGAFLAWLFNAAPGILAKLGEWSKAFTDWVTTKALPALLTALGQMWDGLWTELQKLWGAAFAEGSLGKALVDNLRKGISDNWGGFVGWIVGMIRAIPFIGEWAANQLNGLTGGNTPEPAAPPAPPPAPNAAPAPPGPAKTDPATPAPPDPNRRGGVAWDGARATGGGVKRGGQYVVGEDGAEIFVPSGDGTIVPNPFTSWFTSLFGGTGTTGKQGATSGPIHPASLAAGMANPLSSLEVVARLGAGVHAPAPAHPPARPRAAPARSPATAVAPAAAAAPNGRSAAGNVTVTLTVNNQGITDSEARWQQFKQEIRQMLTDSLNRTLLAEG